MGRKRAIYGRQVQRQGTQNSRKMRTTGGDPNAGGGCAFYGYMSDARVDGVETTTFEGCSYCLAAVPKSPTSTVKKNVGTLAVRSVGGRHSTGGWLWGHRWARGVRLPIPRKDARSRPGHVCSRDGRDDPAAKSYEILRGAIVNRTYGIHKF